MSASTYSAILLALATFLLALMPPPARGRLVKAEEDLDVTLEEGDHTTCCQREPNMNHIGVSDVTGEEIVMDVGHCPRRCGKKKQLKRNEFERLLLDNPDMDPRMLFLLHSGQRRSQQSCPGEEEEMCAASAWRVERLVTTEGVVSVTVTEACECQPRPHSCRHHPRPVTLHKGTPLQTTVDLGHCQGHCYHDLGCKAIKSRTVSVEGPNGAECVSVVEECGCQSSCYRASLYQHVYNYTTEDDPSVQVIDVGTCTGECDIVQEDQCVLRETSGGCMMSLVKRNSRCSPSSTKDMEIHQADGSIRSLTTITHCGCH
ncbi:uncharacterized protein LOC121856292 [Homarus americanus]|uniref:uncharacterized protein LOC121856292 n=1 Tax=Homarus americanus TaxID=6706 RepID=UPI001C45A6EB|nr:uncharacterized protein LOC121856292 [Homarus americanus]